MVDSQNIDLGLWILDAQEVSLLGAMNLASMRGKGKLIMLEDPRQYNLYQM